MWNSTINEWNRAVEKASTFHEEPFFLPESFIKGTMFPVIAMVAVILTIFYALSFQVVNKMLPADTEASKKSKICYQFTNITFNLCVGTVGIYLEYWVLPTLDMYNGDSLDKCLYYHEELYLVSAMQLGYQIWAIPVGIFYVGESFQMILHHFSVVVSTSLSGFLSMGFRYYTPFFYGVMELSSLPLSVMNSFKDNPEWIKKYPSAYGLSRAIFSVVFLLIRVVLCASRWPFFLRDNFIVMYTREMGLFKAYLLVQWSLAAFLACLQLFWAYLILKGIIKLVLPSQKDKKKTKTT